MDSIFNKNDDNPSGPDQRRKPEKVLALAIVICLSLLAVLSSYIGEAAAEGGEAEAPLIIKKTETVETILKKTRPLS